MVVSQKRSRSPSFHSVASRAKGHTTSWPSKERVAFVTLATAAYGEGALVLTAGLRERLPSNVDVVVFSPDELRLVPGVQLRPLSHLPDVPVPLAAGEPLMPHFRFCWAKLGLWTLEDDYDIVVYMDADILIVGDISALLSEPPSDGELKAVPACECWRSERCSYTERGCRGGLNSEASSEDGLYFNAGVMVFRPSVRTYENMLIALQKRKGRVETKADDAMPFAEQDFLNVYFRGRFVAMPPTFNALKHAIKNPKHADALPIENCVALHYVMGKPWMPATKLEEEFQDLRALWWKAKEASSSHAFLRPRWVQRQVNQSLPGLWFVPDFLTPEAEASLVSALYSDKQLQARWHHLRRRRLLCLGGVPHPEGAICEDLPPGLARLGDMLAESRALSGSPNQCLVNSYSPGEGIDAHCDGPRFKSEVAVVTLEGPALLHFGLVEKKAYPELPQRLEVLLQPRSLLVFRDKAYELYVHRIDHARADTTREGQEVPRAPRRTSLTFRHLAHVQLQSKDVSKTAQLAARDAQWQWWESQLNEID